jgi:hypothetical protein
MELSLCSRRMALIDGRERGFFRDSVLAVFGSGYSVCWMDGEVLAY